MNDSKMEYLTTGPMVWEPETMKDVLFLPLLGALSIAGGLIYAGYNVGKLADNLEEGIDKALPVLSEIKDGITKLANNVELIVDLLKNLPDAFEANKLKEYLALAESSASTLHDLMLNRDYMASHETQYLEQLQRLKDAIYYSRRVKGRVAGLIQAAPHIATWTLANTTMQRLNRSTGRGWINPYKTGVHKDITQDIKDIVDNVHPGMKNEWSQYPYFNAVYEFDGTRFNKLDNIPYRDAYGSVLDVGRDAYGLLTLKRRADGSIGLFGLLFFGLGPWQWYDVKLIDPKFTRYKRALEWWEANFMKFLKLSSYLEISTGFDEIIPELKDRVLNIPPEWKE